LTSQGIPNNPCLQCGGPTIHVTHSDERSVTTDEYLRCMTCDAKIRQVQGTEPPTVVVSLCEGKQVTV
jgi:hypothetical protein